MFNVSCFANGTEERNTVNLAVMQGPTGFSSVMLDDYINVSVYPSPNEAVSKIVNKELDMAVLPANTAANLYNKGVQIHAIATVGEGMLSVLGTEEGKFSDTIAVPGAGGTPEHMAMLLFPQYERSYSVTAPAQLAQLMIAGKCSLAVLPQPFVNMVLSQNDNVKIIYDVQKAWMEKTGLMEYPMSVLVVESNFANEHPALVEKVKSSYRKSVESVLENPDEAAFLIEKASIMKASLAEGAIKECAIVYKDGEEAETELKTYLDVIMNLAPQTIGSELPDEDFYRY